MRCGMRRRSIMRERMWGNGAGISGQEEMSMLRLGKQKRAPPLFWDGDGVHYFIRGVWQNGRD